MNLEMKFDIFVVCHEQEIIAQRLPQSGFHYLFVGWGDYEKIRNRDDVTICRLLPDNIEVRKDLLSFTAWYAIVKNNLCNKDYVCVLEYDTEIEKNFWELNSLFSPDNVIGFISHPTNTYHFLDAVISFERYLLMKKKLPGIRNYFREQTEFICTSNAAMHINVLREFVEDFYDIIIDFQSERISPCHERYVSIFCKLNKLNHLMIPNAIKHLQANIHGDSILAINYDYDYGEVVFPYQYLPFNGDIFVEEQVSRLKKKHQLSVAIETGSFLFSTTIWLAKKFQMVFTAENNYDYYRYGNRRMGDRGVKNVSAFLSDSVHFLERIHLSDKTFFFLDAHGNGETPLLDELRIIAERNVRPVIAIHDFFNPSFPELGFDSYKGQGYNYQWIKPYLEDIYSANYSITYNVESCGARRGVIYIEPC